MCNRRKWIKILRKENTSENKSVQNGTFHWSKGSLFAFYRSCWHMLVVCERCSLLSFVMLFNKHLNHTCSTAVDTVKVSDEFKMWAGSLLFCWLYMFSNFTAKNPTQNCYTHRSQWLMSTPNIKFCCRIFFHQHHRTNRKLSSLNESNLVECSIFGFFFCYNKIKCICKSISQSVIRYKFNSITSSMANISHSQFPWIDLYSLYATIKSHLKARKFR